MNAVDQNPLTPVPDAVATESMAAPATPEREATEEILDLESAARMAMAWLPQDG